MYDPYGYYKSKNIYSLDKEPNVPYYDDYPVNDSMWSIGQPYLNLSKTVIPDGEIQKQLDDLTDPNEPCKLTSQIPPEVRRLMSKAKGE